MHKRETLSCWHTFTLFQFTRLKSGERHTRNWRIHFGGCPRIVRTDLGTENVARHPDLHCRDAGSRSGEAAGARTTNQNVESWWGVLRKGEMQYWIQLLSEMKDGDL